MAPTKEEYDELKNASLRVISDQLHLIRILFEQIEQMREKR